MPVATQLVRNGDPVTMPFGWGGFHVNSLLQAMKTELGEDAIAYPRTFMGFPNDPSSYTFTQDHTFTDPEDGEVFIVLAGDVYSAWRTW